MNTIEFKSLREHGKGDMDVEVDAADDANFAKVAIAYQESSGTTPPAAAVGKKIADDELVSDLEARLAKSSLGELGWRDRNGFTDVMRDLERLAAGSWQMAAGLWDKFRPGDPDKPLFIDGDDLSPSHPDKTKNESKPDKTDDTDKDLSSGIPPISLSDRYHVAGNRYYFRSDTKKVAFEDKGKRLTTAYDDRAVVHAMVELAVSKEWGTIRIKGSETFKREAWLAASLRGIEVEGFKPRDIDLAKLAEFQRETKPHMQNAIEKGGEREPAKSDDVDAVATPQDAGVRHSKAERAKYLSSQQNIAIDTLRTILRSRGDSEVAVEMAARLAEERFENRRVHVGKLMDHGMARYMHDPNEESSYFVRLATSDGEKTLWGVDLQRALSSAGIKKGDDITISREELRHLDKFKNEIGADGRPTGKKIPINAIWNRWTVGKLDDIREAAGEQVSKSANDYRGMQPVIKVYDSKAPRQTDLDVPQVGRTDRPRGQEPQVVR